MHLTPHQWRHTLGTRLINRDVPQEVVRRILDHDSPQMTAHYARLHEATIRGTGKRPHVDVTGERRSSSTPTGRWPRPSGPGTTWTGQPGPAERLLRTAGQNACPHANACLTCPMFLTTADFLPRAPPASISTSFSSSPRPRLRAGSRGSAEMNQQVPGNLERIIAALDADPDADAQTATRVFRFCGHPFRLPIG